MPSNCSFFFFDMQIVADPRGYHIGHDPPFGVQGHHMSSGGLTGLQGAPNTCETPEACQGHQRPARDTTGLAGHSRLAGTPLASQGHHGPIRGIKFLPRASQTCQGHMRPSRGTTNPPGSRSTTGLARTPRTCQGT